MNLILIIKTSRSIGACTILPDNPILAITISETISYTLPFINNTPLYAYNNMLLFLFYYYYYNDSAIDIINKYKNKYLDYYKLENISIIFYLLLFLYKNNSF